METLKRKTYYGSMEDEEAIAIIKNRYGLCSESDAVRVALRLVAESKMAQLPSTKKKRKS